MNQTLQLTYKSTLPQIFETGRIARQADGAIWAQEGDTRILASAVFGKKPSDRDFFPLTVNYQEKFYAVGRIPGSFFRREGRPTERETLLCRLIDRPIRPLFPNHFFYEVQVVTTVMSRDDKLETDILALNASSLAVAISGLPISNIMAACRVGYIDGEIIINPTVEQMAVSRLDMVVAGTKDAILMVESEADQLTEEQMLSAVEEAHRCIISYTEQMSQWQNYQDRTVFEPVVVVNELANQARELAQVKLVDAFASVKGAKHERREQIKQLSNECSAEIFTELNIDDSDDRLPALKKALSDIYHDIEKEHLRKEILDHQRRVDGRKLNEIRNIDVTIGDLPKAHGSAIFTRGETQAIVTATLAGKKSSQMVETLDGITHDGFMLHYNFPPFSVGETGMMTGPKRREIGHGKLAKRAIAPVMPDIEEQYTLRIVSEITESNGSSSMASVCGATLAMLDAGIHISANIAGIAMGLVLEGSKFQVLSDILGDEDHLGDMDFKVAGSKDGITALQMDIKIAGVTPEIMKIALDQAKEGRLHILSIMETVIATPSELSVHAPRLVTMQIPKQKIGAVIGKSGVSIKAIQNDFGVEIEIADDGTVSIFAQNEATVTDVANHISDLIADLEQGKTYDAEVEEVRKFGVFAVTATGKSGLIHSSKFPSGFNFEKEYKPGDAIKVVMEEIDAKGRVSFTLDGVDAPQLTIGEKYAVEVVKLVPGLGAIVKVEELPVEGIIHISKLSASFVKNVEDLVAIGDKFSAKLLEVYKGRYQFTLIEGSTPPDGKDGDTDTPAESNSNTTENDNANNEMPVATEEASETDNETVATEPSQSEEDILKNIEIGNYYVVKVSHLNNRLGVFVGCHDHNAKGLLHISKITSDYIEKINKVIKADQLMLAKLSSAENGSEKLSFTTIGLENINQTINQNFPFHQAPLTEGSSCLASVKRQDDGSVMATLSMVTEEGEDMEIHVSIASCPEDIDLSEENYWINYEAETDGTHIGQLIFIEGKPLSHSMVTELALESNSNNS